MNEPTTVSSPEPARPSVSVWTTAQRPAGTQRRARYVPASTAHPAKMLPAIAAHAIATFTQPGEYVLDPMCGIGTTLVEAAHLGRHGLGVEYEPQWVDVAQANLALAAQLGAPGTGHVSTGDARQQLPALADTHAGRVRLLLTSPPYGSSLHGQVTATPGRRGGVRKRDHHYSHDRANLAHRSLPALLRGFTDILRTSLPLLAPGGIVAITTRPFRVDGELIDFPALTLDAAIAAGLTPVQRCVALLAGLRDGRLIPRASFFQLGYIRKRRARGISAHVIAHEDVLILTTPATSLSSEGLVELPRPRTATDGGTSDSVPPPRRRQAASGQTSPRHAGTGGMTATATPPPALTIGSLFTGYGGLDLGVLAALGSGRIAWCSDNDRAVATLLRARFPGSPNLGDIRDIDFRALEPVEVLTAGWPCQDISAAGKRAGMQKGIRSGLFTHVIRALRELPRPPRLVVLENVAALRWKNGGLTHVLGQLAETGFDAVWRSVRASDIGAPHRRERVFVLAWPREVVAIPTDPDCARRQLQRCRSGQQAGRANAAGSATHAADPDRGRRSLGGDPDRAQTRALNAYRLRDADRRDADAAHPARERRHQGLPRAARFQGRPDAAVGGDAAAADPDDRRRNGWPPQQIRYPQERTVAGRDRHPDLDWGPYGQAIERWERILGRPTPYPTQPGRHGRPVLGARFVEFLMGLDDGYLSDLDLSRTALLRILGNGVVPQQAAHAIRNLLADRSVVCGEAEGSA